MVQTEDVADATGVLFITLGATSTGAFFFTIFSL